MRIPYLGVLLVVFSISVFPAFGQENTDDTEPKEKLHKDVEKAYDAYDAQEYTLAIELLKTALGEVRGRDDKSTVLFKIAESYRNINDYKNAENYYLKAVKLGYKDPIAQLHYADMLKAQGEYEEAIVAYQDFKQENPTDRRAEIGIESTKKAIEWMDSPSRYQVDLMKDLNSTGYDFSPSYAGKRADDNEIIFTSTREESVGKKEDGWTGGSFMDIYVSSAERKEKGRRGRGASTDEDELVSPASLKWSTPKLLDEEIVNTKSHEGSAVFDSRRKELYLTRCLVEKDKKFGCGIYISEKLGVNWKEPEQVIIGTDTSANVGQPALSPDDSRLYFVSDEFNTKGVHDIFMTTFDRRAKTWKTPTNLGSKVNTDREEYYPFISGDGQYLYWASNGLPGMGGLDIFRIKLGEDGMPAPNAEAENLEYPINTSFDDFGLVFQGTKDEVGFLSSNRKGSKNDDIYGVVKTPLVFELEGVVTSSKTGLPIPQATVKLDGSNGTSVVVNADKDGYYIFDKDKIDADVQYTLTFEKAKFLTNTGNTTTIGVDLSAFEYIPSANQFLHKLQVNKALDPIEEPIVLPNVFFDLAKWDLRPEARAALDSVVPIMKNNPTIVIELRSHTDYRGDNKSNDVLSQHRADTCVSYLVSKGIAADRMVARGMGETEPFNIQEGYKGYGAGQLEEGNRLTEAYIKRLPPEKQEVANQVNRRTDFKVLRDDYVPAAGPVDQDAVDPKDIIADKNSGVNNDPPGDIYIIKGRESFGVVAKKNKINIVELKKLNGGLRGVRPFEGLQLKVTPDGNYEAWDANHYQVDRANQSIKDIAKKLDLDDKVLEDLNPEIDKKNVPAGYYLKIK
ncbi:OmpA family protein [Owenweeksia hongkongensis]|uniref:OmpA family protein n=1 Tax=Owenweeksia hongkongensis TaxID=253245 RepID=UPI003A8D6360